MDRQFTLSELENMETISQGHFDNLKIEESHLRVWLSRMTVADGQPYNNQVTIEMFIGGVWCTTDQYEAK